MDIDELINRLAEATGPDRELDMAIAMATDTVIQECCGRGRPVERGGALIGQECCGCPELEAPHYTGEQFDRLIPAGYIVATHTSVNMDERVDDDGTVIPARRYEAVTLLNQKIGHMVRGQHPSCGVRACLIAALRALQASTPTGAA